MRTRPNYGIDSPGIVAGYLACGGAGVAVAWLYPHVGGRGHWVFWWFGAYCLLGAAGMLYYSLAGKLRIRDEILAGIPWRGDEQVLDAGCGRGLLAIGAARRLVSGRVVGLDLWLRGALSGNSPEAVMSNAAAEGVANLVEARRGSVLELPFADGSFDVVLSNFVLHEVKSAAERKRMLGELLRVLRPGGRLALVDFIFTGEAVQLCRELGAGDAVRRRVGSRLGWLLALLANGGIVRTYRVTATRPAA